MGMFAYRCATRRLEMHFANSDTGYNMARNLQAKLPSSDTLRIYDINQESLTRFADETKALSRGAAVQIASTVREAAEDSVSHLSLQLFSLLRFISIFHVMSLFYQ